MKKIIAGFGLTVLVVACGGDGGGIGVSGSKKITALSESERRSICTYIADFLGPERTVTCMDGTSGMVGIAPAERAMQIDECVTGIAADSAMFPMCELIVSDVQNCYDAIDKLNDEQRYCDPNQQPPAACDRLDMVGSGPNCSTQN